MSLFCSGVFNTLKIPTIRYILSKTNPLHLCCLCRRARFGSLARLLNGSNRNVCGRSKVIDHAFYCSKGMDLIDLVSGEGGSYVIQLT